MVKSYGITVIELEQLRLLFLNYDTEVLQALIFLPETA